MLMKREFSQQIFETYLGIKFHENPSGGIRVPYGRTHRRTDRHDDANSRFSQLCEETQKRLPCADLGEEYSICLGFMGSFSGACFTMNMFAGVFPVLC